MTLELVPLQPLERGYLWVMRVRSALTWLLLSALAAVGDGLLHWRTGFAFGVITGPIVLFGIVSVAVLVPGRFRRWGYAFTDRELHVSSGWFTRVHTVVPVSRVQHIDVSQGPLERKAGVATLTLHTAGMVSSVVALPGISRERADDIRDSIRSRISDAPW